MGNFSAHVSINLIIRWNFLPTNLCVSLFSTFFNFIKYQMLIFMYTFIYTEENQLDTTAHIWSQGRFTKGEKAFAPCNIVC